jgi:hypothetical protein
MLLFARYAELSQHLEAGGLLPIKAPADGPDASLSQRVAGAVVRQRSGL